MTRRDRDRWKEPLRIGGIFMSGKLLLFGFEELPAILAAAAAASPMGAEVVPVARRDYNKPLAVLAGLDDDPGTLLPFAGGPLGGRMIVFCGLEAQMDALLPALAGAGIDRECLKAVLDGGEAVSGAAGRASGASRAVRDADSGFGVSAGMPLPV